MNLFESLKISQRNNSLLLIPPPPSQQFSYLGPKIWNSVYKKILTDSEQDLSTNLSLVKNSIKRLLLKIQKEHDENEWVPANFSLY